MTNGRGAAMASFMTKKKKYRFQVDICLEELLEVPFVNAVFFAKVRLLDGGNFQDYSSREEVRDHTVKWGAKFSFPCKMMANASTVVLERCVLRISVRKESKGGRSFTKLGFVDLNLAEYAGAGVTQKKALLEGYDARHRQDNSMLRFSIKMIMLSGDILFKVPSPSLKHKTIASDEQTTEQRGEEYSSGSLAGSIASGSSGFGSLPKKRPALSSDFLGHPLSEGLNPPSEMPDTLQLPQEPHEEISHEHGHSRNSSNTSQLSKASGYSSIHSHSHSRQSSSGDSGHIRNPTRAMMASLSNPTISKMSFPLMRKNTYPNKFLTQNSPTPDESFQTPNGELNEPDFDAFKNDNNQNQNSSGYESDFDSFKNANNNLNATVYYTPKAYKSQISNLSSSSAEEYRTPNGSFTNSDVFPVELRKSCSCSVVEQRVKNMSTIDEIVDNSISIQKNQLRNSTNQKNLPSNRTSLPTKTSDSISRSKSNNQIPSMKPSNRMQSPKSEGNLFRKISQKSKDNLLAFLTPSMRRRNDVKHHSTPNPSPRNGHFKIPGSPVQKQLRSLPETRATSLSSLKSGMIGMDAYRGLPHRKLLENSTGGKLAPVAISPDETPDTDCSQNATVRRPSVTTNPSSNSLVLSETGSLDRAKAALERRKKAQLQDTEVAPGRVEVTRVNPDDLIADLLKSTNLEQADDSAESSGLQLFIAKDGTAALGSHEVKSQMSTGVQMFKQVVMEDNR